MWDEAFKEGEFEYVVHTAAPLLDNPGNTDFVRDFLKPMLGGEFVYFAFAKRKRRGGGGEEKC